MWMTNNLDCIYKHWHSILWYVPRTRHQTNSFRPPVCAICRQFTTTSHRVKWCVYLPSPPPPPPPPISTMQKKWRVLGLGRKNSSLNQGRVGFVSHFIQTKVVVWKEICCLSYVSDTDIKVEGVLRTGRKGGVLKKKNCLILLGLCARWFLCGGIRVRGKW